jgi:alkanesulfonate monooxygenase SsuD/methylene tetrahydromethanopterin reductase-like flavin-dependent oxidoreductase (luciferase family)
VKVGITLPQFRHEADTALDAAARAEATGLDGVFVFDHLWPIGQPERPALHGPTLLAAVAAETERVSVGTLVARVGLLPDAVLVQVLRTVARITGPRLIAGLGVGDHLSRPENLAYGVPFAPVAARLARLAGVCRELRASGITTWVGGRSEAVRSVGRAEAGVLNLWDVDPAEVAAEVARGEGRTVVTWGGQVDLARRTMAEVSAFLRAMESAGATWAVVAPVGAPWPEAVESIAAAAGALVD